MLRQARQLRSKLMGQNGSRLALIHIRSDNLALAAHWSLTSRDLTLPASWAWQSATHAAQYSCKQSHEIIPLPFRAEKARNFTNRDVSAFPSAMLPVCTFPSGSPPNGVGHPCFLPCSPSQKVGDHSASRTPLAVVFRQAVRTLWVAPFSGTPPSSTTSKEKFGR